MGISVSMRPRYTLRKALVNPKYKTEKGNYLLCRVRDPVPQL